MNTYHFRADPSHGFPLASAAHQLTVDVVRGALPSAIVHELTLAEGGYDLVVQLQRDAHADALQQISDAFEQLGYTIVRAVVVEWVSAAVEAGLAAAGVGGVLGAAGTRDVSMAIAGAIVGGFAGYVFGSQRQTPSTIYDAQRVHPFSGGWQLTQRPRPGTQPLGYQSP